MGKRQHQSDKMYLTAKEWTQFFGGKKPEQGGKSDFKRLPFDHCSLSLQPYEHPYCTKDGVIFDLVHIVPYLKKFKTNPITGEAMDAKALVKLNVAKNSNGKYHCPVTFKVFTNNSHIVAVKNTGNVYAYEAVEELNIKTKNWKDLLTDEPFKRKDLITLQDPTNVEKFNISMFYHIQNNVKVETEAEKKAKAGASYHLNATNSTAKDVLKELYRDYKPAEKVEEDKPALDHLNSAHYSTGMMAAGFTSTAMTPQTRHEAEVIDEDIIRYERVAKLKKKGYVRLVTNKGVLNLELHCEMVAKTCENFMKLCEKGYYKGTKFHRSIKHFMIQGGDPTGTGTGGESIWDKTFADEFKPNLSHTGRGILSMANSGPDTNKSQFFITFRSCKHLDGKHTIFGRLVGGLDTLQAMESVERDEKTDRPLKDIIIEDTLIFVNPYDEADEQIAKERQKVKDEEAKAKAPVVKSSAVTLNAEEKPTVYRPGVGKYISSSSANTSTADSPGPSTSSSTKRPSAEPKTSTATVESYASQKKKSKSSRSLTDFSGW